MIDLLQIKSCKEFFTLFLKLYKERKYQMTILRWSIWRRRNDKVWKNKMSQVNLWLGEGRSFSRVGSVHRWKISGGELTLETPSLKVSENQNMNDSNSTWILVSIWFVIPLELVCVFVMSMGDWFSQSFRYLFIYRVGRWLVLLIKQVSRSNAILDTIRYDQNKT